MPAIDLGLLPATTLSRPVLDVLTGTSVDKQIISDRLNSALKSELTSSATSSNNSVLANLLQTLQPADLAAEQNLSLRDFVGRHTTLPIDPGAKKAALDAIAMLSSTTTVGALLGLNGTIDSNPVFGALVAQTKLASLLATSPGLSNVQLRTDFINKYATFRGTMKDFWAQLSQNPEFKATVPELQLTAQLGTLTLGNAPLVTALREAYKPSSPRDLTKLDAPTLQQLIASQKIPLPTAIPGTTPAEQLGNYVNGIIGLLTAAFPTDYLAKGLAAATDPPG